MPATKPAVFLVARLCEVLAEQDIIYCHWKSNNALDRSASGDNDLDLLVAKEDITRFTEVLYQLGFKRAIAPADKQMVGVTDYYGYDEEADRIIHVHAHYQLVLGHDMTKNFRLPIEKPYLESATQGELFKVPAPEFEFVVFVVRMVLKHFIWDMGYRRGDVLKTSERRELDYLRERIRQERVDAILKEHLPYVERELFDACVQALQPDYSPSTQRKIGRQFLTSLESNARRPRLIDGVIGLWRRVNLAIRYRVYKSAPRYRLESGGAMIALVGGDGAGKSTAIDALYDLLSKHFETRKVHMGKPTWSSTTITIRAVLKLGQLLHLYPLEASFEETLLQRSPISPGYPWLIREVCRARDRYWTYVKARRFAASAGVVIFDRFPLPAIQLMDGPQTERFIDRLGQSPQSRLWLSPRRADRLARFLMARERAYYRRIMPPELVIVLRLDPEVAVTRKPQDDPTTVRARAIEIAEINWSQRGTYVLDASKPKSEIASVLKTLVWFKL